MKKVVSILTLGMLSVSAFASDARVDVFGGGVKFGSIWVDDHNDVFYNPAFVNKYTNFIVVEKDAVGTSGHGGYYGKYSMFSYGLHVNKKDPLDATLMSALATGIKHKDGAATNFTTAGLTSVSNLDSRPVNLFIGADFGFKLGMGLHLNMGSTKNPVATAFNPKYSQADLSLGAEFFNFMPFLDIGLGKKLSMDTSGTPAGTNATNTKLAAGAITNVKESPMVAGVKYYWDVVSPYVIYSSVKHDVDMWDGTKTLSRSSLNKTSGIHLGVTKEMRMKDGKIHMALGYATYKNTFDTGVQYTKVDTTYTQVPGMFGGEYELAPWITLRGAAQFDLVNNKKVVTAVQTGSSEFTDPMAGMTKFNVGSTLKFGHVEIDSTVSKAQGRNAGFEAATLTDVAVRYMF